MPLARTGYSLQFEEIVPGQPQFGSAAVVPWDSDIFGFNVASYQTSVIALEERDSRVFQQHFRCWMEARGVRLCSCSLPAEATFWRKALQQTGFQFVDLTLQPSLAGPGAARLPDHRFPVRFAETKDQPAIKMIASESFAHGRYHA